MNFCKTLNYGTMIIKLFHILQTGGGVWRTNFTLRRCMKYAFCGQDTRILIGFISQFIQPAFSPLILFLYSLQQYFTVHAAATVLYAYILIQILRETSGSLIVSPFLIYFKAILSLHLKNVSVDEGYITFTVGSDSHSVFQNLHKYLSSKTTD